MIIGAVDSQALASGARLLEPLGTLWLNALRMVVIPLVIALLITGSASATETASTGRLTARSLITFVVLLAVTAGIGAILVPAALAWLPVDSESAAALRGSAGSAHTTIPNLPPIGEWITTIVP